MAGKGRDVGEDLVKSLQNTKYSVDEKLEKTFINLFGKKTSASSEKKLVAEDELEGSDTESSHESESGDDAEDDVENNDTKIKQKTEIHGGRLRRRAIFKDEVGESDAMVISLYDMIYCNPSLYYFSHIISLIILVTMRSRVSDCKSCCPLFLFLLCVFLLLQSPLLSHNLERNGE